MILRPLIFLGVIGLAISVPILLNKKTDDIPKWGEDQDNANPYLFDASKNPSSYSASLTGNNANPLSLASGPNQIPNLVYPNIQSAHQPVYLPVANFGEVFRFDITPEWIKSRWQRVSTTPPAEGLTGMRVPLVTGPHATDLHGSLTYYFDSGQQVRRLTFRGWTGDASRLVAFVTQQHGFESQKSLAAGLYLKKSWGKVKGVLRMDNPAVIQKKLVNQQLMVLLEINHPNGQLNLSQQTSNILSAMPE